MDLDTKNVIFETGSGKGSLQLWDVRNWERFYSNVFEGMEALSLHLTSNSKYLTVAGWGGKDGCVVLEIQ